MAQFRLHGKKCYIRMSWNDITMPELYLGFFKADYQRGSRARGPMFFSANGLKVGQLPIPTQVHYHSFF